MQIWWPWHVGACPNISKCCCGSHLFLPVTRFSKSSALQLHLNALWLKIIVGPKAIESSIQNMPHHGVTLPANGVNAIEQRLDWLGRSHVRNVWIILKVRETVSILIASRERRSDLPDNRKRKFYTSSGLFAWSTEIIHCCTNLNQKLKVILLSLLGPLGLRPKESEIRYWPCMCYNTYKVQGYAMSTDECEKGFNLIYLNARTLYISRIGVRRLLSPKYVSFQPAGFRFYGTLSASDLDDVIQSLRLSCEVCRLRLIAPHGNAGPSKYSIHLSGTQSRLTKQSQTSHKSARAL